MIVNMASAFAKEEEGKSKKCMLAHMRCKAYYTLQYYLVFVAILRYVCPSKPTLTGYVSQSEQELKEPTMSIVKF